MATVKLPPGYSPKAIANAAGQYDFEKYYLSGDDLYVDGVTQEALEAALAAYDPVAETRKQQIVIATQQMDLLQADASKASAGLIDGFVLGLLTDEEEQRFRSFAAYKLEIMRVPDQPGYPAEIVWPQMPE